MITMNDIAMQVGLSRQAVSAVLNGNGACRVSVQNRDRILQTAVRMNYVSNSAARSLKGASTRTIGIMGPMVDTAVNASLNAEITKMFLARGYNLLYNEYGYGAQDSRQSILQLIARGVDGIVFNCHYDTSEIEQISPMVPYVLIGENGNAHQLADIKIDVEYGGYLATRHLLGHGHQKVAMMLIQSTQKEHLRYSGWIRAHAEAGVEVGNSDTIILQQLDGRVDLLLDVLRKKKVTAVFAFNDYIGAKLIRVLQQNKIRVPEDIAVIGTDGVVFVDFLSPTLTTVFNPIRARAEFALDLLLKRIENKECHCEPVGHWIKPNLYLGESCGCERKVIDRMYRLNSFSMLEKDAMMNYGIDVMPVDLANEKRPACKGENTSTAVASGIGEMTIRCQS